VPVLQKRFLMGIPFFKKGSPVSAFIAPSGVSYEMMRANEVRSQVLEPVEVSILRSNSVPLSLRRGYSAMKAPRLVPLAQEMATEGAANPSKSNGA
jgi:hypothetical protein